MKKTRLHSRLLVAALALGLSAFAAKAQNPDENPTGAARDSIVYRLSPVVDTTLVGQSVWNALPSRKNSGYGATAGFRAILMSS